MERVCLYCGERLTPKIRGDKIEEQRDFVKRQFCNRVCSGKYNAQKRGKTPAIEVKQAENDLKSGDIQQKLTAYEFLENLINNDDADNYIRLNAAKALLPFQAKRKGEGGANKKEERQEAAEKAAKGKFQPGAPPAKIVSIK